MSERPSWPKRVYDKEHDKVGIRDTVSKTKNVELHTTADSMFKVMRQVTLTGIFWEQMIAQVPGSGKVVQKAANEGAQCRLCLPNLEAEGKVSYGRLDCQKLYERPGSIP